MNVDVCPICGGPISVPKVMLLYDGEQGGGALLQSDCPECGIPVSKITGKNTSEWFASSVDSESLTTQLNELEIVAISEKLARYKTLLPKWQQFLGRRRVDDEIWRFANSRTGMFGAVIVRNGVPIADFRMMSEL